jgi:hypothetical protein
VGRVGYAVISCADGFMVGQRRVDDILFSDGSTTCFLGTILGGTYWIVILGFNSACCIHDS